MTEQGNAGWGMTVSRRFDNDAEANKAVGSLREAGFLEGEIRVWHQKRAAVARGEDTLARTMEGLLAGGVFGGLTAFFTYIAFIWTDTQSVTEEAAVVAALAGAIGGAIVVALAVTVLSRKYAFSHPHEAHVGPGSVVTVAAGDREAKAKEVFNRLD